MSTLGFSIVALVVFVVGAVVLFNLWQSRGSRRRQEGERAGYPGRTDPLARSASSGRPGAAARGRAGERRWQPGADQNAWARQRQEPTLTADDGTTPAARPLQGSGADRFDGAGHSHPAPDPAFRMSADDDAEYRSGDDDDLGPPQFEAPRLEPVPFEPPSAEPPAFETPRFEPSKLAPLRPDEARAAFPRLDPVGATPPPGARARPVPASFEDTRPIHSTPGSAAGAAAGSATGPAPGSTQAGRPAAANAAAANAAAAAAGSPRAPLGAAAGEPAGKPAGKPTAPAAAVEPVFVPAEVDLVVTLIPRSPVNADRLIALTSSLRHVGSKSIRIEIDGGQGSWIALQSGTMVGCLRCSVLLANRQGPLNAVELSDFSAAMELLAGQIGARFVAPDMNQVLRQARELDTVAARLDTQVDLGVEAAEPITPVRMAAIARKLDLFDRGGGRFACYAEAGDLLYSLMAGERADLLHFVLDVPRTAQGHDPWRSMVACASGCAQLVGGRVVDGAGRGMSVGMIDSVGQQIGKRYQELEAVGLKAGAPATLRVFN